jgi:hypothetical protein
MSSCWTPTNAGLLVLVLAVSFLSPRESARAQKDMNTTPPQPKETNTDDGWHVAITPYLWFSSIHGTTGAIGREASVHTSFSDIFNYVNIGAMSVLEARYKRVLMPVDFMWMKLSDDRALPINVVALSIKAKMTETMLTPKIGYRIADGKRVKVDALFGFRYWHLSVPPEGSQIQESFQSGKAALQPSEGGIVALVFGDYAKPGDSVKLTFDTASKKIQGYDVSTYLDAPEDVVTLRVAFDNLSDGTNYVAQSVLDATAKQIQIRTTNSGYGKL